MHVFVTSSLGSAS